MNSPDITNNIFIKPFLSNVLTDADISMKMLRLDAIHPEISGNKWYKLKYHLQEMKSRNCTTLLTFGGAFSNHIAAVAAAGKLLGFNTIGVIRGLDSQNKPSGTLHTAIANGMKMYCVTREEYKSKNSPGFEHELKNKFGDFILVPEGGHSNSGCRGAGEIIDEIPVDFDYIVCACGTGTMLAGIVSQLKAHQTAIGFPVLKAENSITNTVVDYLNFIGTGKKNFELQTGYAFGGYAKYTPELIEFMRSFKQTNAFELDLVYTAKMMFGLFDLIRKGYFKKGSRIIAIHSGGLQGNNSIQHLLT